MYKYNYTIISSWCHMFCRCAIVGSSLAEEILLENEGIFLLLDLLEVIKRFC